MEVDQKLPSETITRIARSSPTAHREKSLVYVLISKNPIDRKGGGIHLLPKSYYIFVRYVFDIEILTEIRSNERKTIESDSNKKDARKELRSSGIPAPIWSFSTGL
jgi:hypothetical protein